MYFNNLRYLHIGEDILIERNYYGRFKVVFKISYVQVLDYWAYYCHIAGIHMGVELSEFGSSEKEKNNIWK